MSDESPYWCCKNWHETKSLSGKNTLAEEISPAIIFYYSRQLISKIAKAIGKIYKQTKNKQTKNENFSLPVSSFLHRSKSQMPGLDKTSFLPFSVFLLACHTLLGVVYISQTQEVHTELWEKSFLLSQSQYPLLSPKNNNNNKKKWLTVESLRTRRFSATHGNRKWTFRMARHKSLPDFQTNRFCWCKDS